MICKNCSHHLERIVLRCPLCHTRVKNSDFILQLILKTDEIIAVTCLFIMIVVVLLQIVLRNFFQTGIGGADPLVRHLVLWVVFLGAGIAAKDNSHIRIDFLSKIIPEGGRKLIENLVSIFSLTVLCIMVYAAVSFIHMEYRSGLDIPLLNIPVWVTELVIPLGYIIIIAHTLINLFSEKRPF